MPAGETVRYACEVALRIQASAFVYLSTTGVYGRNELGENTEWVDEDSSVDIHDPGALVDGSIRATERITEVTAKTIGHVGLEVGEACRRLHHVRMRGLQVNVLELDEIWSFVGKKEKRVKPEDPPEVGDQYAFIGMDAMALGITDHPWSVAELMDAALQIAPEDAPRLPAREEAAPPPTEEALPVVDDRQLCLLRPRRAACPACWGARR